MPRKIKLKRREAEWIEHPWAEETPYGCLVSNYECSHCFNWANESYDYCPNCGHKMTEVIRNNKE